MLRRWLTRDGLERVRVLGPTVWCTTAIGATYLGCAAYEVYSDVQQRRPDWRFGSSASSSPLTFEQLEADRAVAHVRGGLSSGPRRAVDAWQPAWLADSSTVVRASICASGGVYALNRMSPRTGQYFAHMPFMPRNYTLFTSMFGHDGLLHLGLNMLALACFAPHVQQNRIFQGSDSHFAAFYLGSGLASNLGHHLSTTVWPSRPKRFLPSLGASGAIFAILSVYALSDPEARMGIGGQSAKDALLFLTALEAYGFFFGFPFFDIGHGAHLAGLAVGAAYVHFNGRERLWTPARRLAFYSMRRFKWI